MRRSLFVGLVLVAPLLVSVGPAGSEPRGSGTQDVEHARSPATSEKLSNAIRTSLSANQSSLDMVWIPISGAPTKPVDVRSG